MDCRHFSGNPSHLIAVPIDSHGTGSSKIPEKSGLGASPCLHLNRFYSRLFFYMQNHMA
jgi:hypothetical protein